MEYKYDKIELLVKVDNIIKSCKTKAHLGTAYKYFDLVMSVISKNEDLNTYLIFRRTILTDLRAKSKELGVSNES